MKSKKPQARVVSAIAKPEKKQKFLIRKIPLLYLLPLLALTVFMYYKNSNDIAVAPEPRVQADVSQPNYKSYRQRDFSFTQPLLLFENENEAPELLPLKRQVSFLINQLIAENTIENASVYVNRLSADQWFSINPGYTFTPASLLKIPYLMIYLKQSEKDPGLLDRKYTMSERKSFIPDQSFKSKGIEFGKPYSVRDLLTYMIVYSDNNATFLLDQHLDYEALQKLFMDIGMEKPDLTRTDYKLTVFDYSKFFQVLYGATYLNHANSEYALSLLAQCDFRKGMVSGVPAGITVAHKFGEGGRLDKGGIREFHESGIIYLQNDPVVVSIFTRGKNVNFLPEAISRLTKEIVSGINGLANPSQSRTSKR